MEHEPGLEIAADESENLGVLDPARDARHQDVMINPVEELLQVEVDDPFGPVFGESAGLAHSLVRTAPGSKAEAKVRKRGVKERREHL